MYDEGFAQLYLVVSASDSGIDFDLMLLSFSDIDSVLYYLLCYFFLNVVHIVLYLWLAVFGTAYYHTINSAVCTLAFKSEVLIYERALLCSSRLQLIGQKYSKHSNIV